MKTSQLSCKKCLSSKIIKNGTETGKQRYKCKDCGTIFKEYTPKYSSLFKLQTIKMRSGAMSLRAIARIKKIHHSVIAYWLKKSGQIAKQALCAQEDKGPEKDTSR